MHRPPTVNDLHSRVRVQPEEPRYQQPLTPQKNTGPRMQRFEEEMLDIRAGRPNSLGSTGDSGMMSGGPERTFDRRPVPMDQCLDNIFPGTSIRIYEKQDTGPTRHQ